MSHEDRIKVYKAIKKQCLTTPIYIDTTRNPYREDELEFKLVKNKDEITYELNVYDIDTYKSVHYGNYYKKELMDHMLKVFTEETKEFTTMRLYLMYDYDKKTFILDNR